MEVFSLFLKHLWPIHINYIDIIRHLASSTFKNKNTIRSSLVYSNTFLTFREDLISELVSSFIILQEYSSR